MNVRPGLRTIALTGIVAISGLAYGQTVTPAATAAPAGAPTAVPVAQPTVTPIVASTAAAAPASNSSVTPTPSPAPAPTSEPVAQATTVVSAAQAGDTLETEIINFTLENLAVSVGTTVVWENRDTAPHTATAGNSPRPSGEWGSPLLQKGGVFQFTFDQSGAYSYFCTVHPDMVATVTVTDGPVIAAAPQSPTATAIPEPTTAPAPAMTATPAAASSPAATSIPVLAAPVSPPDDALSSDIVDFTLEDLTITTGTTVTWRNLDAAPHTSTSGDSPTASGDWDSGILNQDQSFSFTFEEVGSFPYFCSVHPFMIATVTVVNEAEPAPTLPAPVAMPMPPTPMPEPTSTPEPVGQVVSSDIVDFTLENLTVGIGTTVVRTN